MKIRPLTDKLLGSKTLVTEHRTYLVDAIGKKGISRASTAARTDILEQKDVEVSRLKSHTITRSSKSFLQIATTFPVVAHFIPVPSSEDDVEQPDGSYTTAVVYADTSVLAGSTMSIAVFDPDLAVDKIQITVFNATTGETEFVTLSRIGAGMYRGEIPTVLKRFRGEDFDCILNVSPGDRISLIYGDGRDASGSPRNVIKHVTIDTDFIEPTLMVRRAIRPDGILGVCVHGTKEVIPEVTVTNMRNGENTRLQLRQVGDRYQGFMEVARSIILQEGDSLRVSFTYSDQYGQPASIEAFSTVVSSGETAGILNVPDVITPTAAILIDLDDPDVTTDYVDLILTGEQTNTFTRLRATRMAEYVGRYQLSYKLDTVRFTNDTSLTITYTDMVAGAPKLLRKRIVIDRSVAAPQQPTTPVEAPTEESVQQMALQMEINGLFTLNGSFNGLIKLYARDNQIVRCSIIQAS